MNLNYWLAEVEVEDLRVEGRQVGSGEEDHDFVIGIPVHDASYNLDRRVNLHRFGMNYVPLVDLGVGLSSRVEIMYAVDRLVVRTHTICHY